MRRIKSIGEIAVKDDSRVDFELVFANGSTQTFGLPISSLTDFAARLTEATFVLAQSTGSAYEYEIATQQGTGRIRLRIGPREGQKLDLLLGRTSARELGEQLIQAAEGPSPRDQPR